MLFTYLSKLFSKIWCKYMIHNYKLFYEHAHTYSDVHNNQQYDSNSANLCNDFFTGFEQFEQSYATYMCVIHIFTNFKPIQAEGNVAHVRLVCSGGPASENHMVCVKSVRTAKQLIIRK